MKELKIRDWVLVPWANRVHLKILYGVFFWFQYRTSTQDNGIKIDGEFRDLVRRIILFLQVMIDPPRMITMITLLRITLISTRVCKNYIGFGLLFRRLRWARPHDSLFNKTSETKISTNFVIFATLSAKVTIHFAVSNVVHYTCRSSIGSWTVRYCCYPFFDLLRSSFVTINRVDVVDRSGSNSSHCRRQW